MNVPDDWAAGAARTLHEVVRLPDATVATVAVDHGAGATATAGAAGSRFEIGSLTKVVTGLALASLVVDGTLGLDDRIGHWLDAGPNAHLTVVQLATHTSGLPTAAAGGVPGDPYRHLTADRAEQELRGLRPVPGAYLYSNFGYQLLGLLLERAAGER